MQLFGTSGVRRVADRDLLDLALRLGLAVGAVYRRVIVGRDTRTTSDALRHAFISGLLAGGATASDAGVVPTPTLALAARDFHAAAMITASHNPPEYNGIKLLNPDGSAFASTQRTEIERLALDPSLSTAPWEKAASSCAHDGAIERHVERILQDFPGPLQLKVAVDCGCGATSVATPYLLRRLGCEVLALHCYPSGFFPHGAEPGEGNLADLMRATRESGAALGVAHDGDGDRMMAVDDLGRFIAGDKLLAILAREAGAKQVVTTIDASMALDEMGLNISRTPVGDNWVSEALKEGGDFGGEPSGAWVFPRVSLCPDGVYAAARLVEIASRHRLSALVDTIPAYPVLRGSVPGDGALITRLVPRLLELRPTSSSLVDGIRLAFADGWLLVRASGTEPKIRLTAEARTGARARQLYDQGAAAVRESMEAAA